MPNTALSNIGIGALNAYLQWRSERRDDRLIREDQAWKSREASLQRDSNINYLREQDRLIQDRYDLNKEDENKRHDLEYRQGIFKGIIDQADPESLSKLSDEDIQRITELADGVFDPEQVKLMLNLNQRLKPKAKTAGDGASRKPTDMSLLKTDLTSMLGFEPGADVIRSVGGRMDQTGEAPLYALQALYPDPNSIPKSDKAETGGPALKDLAGIIGNLETAYPEITKRAGANNISITGIAKRVQAGEEPEDAERHETADNYAATISQQLQIDPNQPLDMSLINSVLKQSGFSAIQGEQQRTLPDLVDEMIRHNVGVGGKKSQMETIMALIGGALQPPQQQQSRGAPSGLLRGALKLGAAVTPGVTYEDLTRQRQGVAYDPRRPGPGQQGMNKP